MGEMPRVCYTKPSNSNALSRWARLGRLPLGKNRRIQIDSVSEAETLDVGEGTSMVGR